MNYIYGKKKIIFISLVLEVIKTILIWSRNITYHNTILTRTRLFDNNISDNLLLIISVPIGIRMHIKMSTKISYLTGIPL